MNLQDLESLRWRISDAYMTAILDSRELDLRPSTKLVLTSPRRIEIRVSSVRDGRVPLGEPLVFTIQEARDMGSGVLERILDHLSIASKLNKLL